MAQQREAVQKAIIRHLDRLTLARKITWEHEGQTYKARHGELIFEIEDSGQNWLKIKRNDDGNPSVITDQHEEVSYLIDTFTHGLFAFEMSERAKKVGHELDLEFDSILETLRQGA